MFVGTSFKGHFGVQLHFTSRQGPAFEAIGLDCASRQRGSNCCSIDVLHLWRCRGYIPSIIKLWFLGRYSPSVHHPRDVWSIVGDGRHCVVEHLVDAPRHGPPQCRQSDPTCCQSKRHQGFYSPTKGTNHKAFDSLHWIRRSVNLFVEFVVVSLERWIVSTSFVFERGVWHREHFGTFQFVDE